MPGLAWFEVFGGSCGVEGVLQAVRLFVTVLIAQSC